MLSLVACWWSWQLNPWFRPSQLNPLFRPSLLNHWLPPSQLNELLPPFHQYLAPPIDLFPLLNKTFSTRFMLSWLQAY